ncbi:transposase, partial [Candidatus Magnetomorum sp. HK-1]
FEFFGGIPQDVKIDNLKAAILNANFYEPVYQKLYKQFADHYGFNSIPCRVYSPNDKGKVESGIKYVKTNFFAGRKFENETDLKKRLNNWIAKKCNSRIHSTTRKIPKEIFETQEKSKLLLLPTSDFKFLDVGTRKVYHDCHIFVDYNYYSIPYQYVGKEVEIELSNNLLKVYFNYQEIAVHPKISGKGEFSTINEHYPKYKMISTTEYQEKYQAKMSKIGGFAELIFVLILQKNPNYWQRSVQGIISLTKTYSNEIVNLSCKRALAYNVNT